MFRISICVVIAAVLGCENDSSSSSTGSLVDLPPSANEDGGQSSGDAGEMSPVNLDGVERPADNGVCAPSEAMWDASVGAAFEQHCGDCHGADVSNGAPFSLTDISPFLPADSTVRDSVLHSLAMGTMPPPGLGRLGSEERQAMIDWASCSDPQWQPGASSVNPGGDFDVNRMPVTSENRLPPETDFFELRANDFAVPADSDTIECFTFELPVMEERFVKRIEVIIDEGQVLHHALVIPEAVTAPGEHRPCADANALALVYGWAPGQGALEFPEGGVRVKPGDTMTLQIHYNNRAGFEGLKDSSGVRFYHGPPEGKEYGMLTLGTLGFNIPAQSVKEVPGWCSVPAEMEIFAAFPHMHEKGMALDTQIIRESGESESLIDLSGWSFDYQYFYDTPTTVGIGDVLKTTCQFRNDTDESIGFGSRTQDEMCFNFVYVSPPPPIDYCNQRTEPIGQTYEPGECAAPDFVDRTPRRITARFLDEAAPELSGGEGFEALWAVSSLNVFLGDVPFDGFEVDLEQSRVDAFGLVRVTGDEITLDVVADIRAVAMGLGFSSVQNYTFSGPYSVEGSAQNEMLVQPVCGEVPNSDSRFWFEREAGAGVLQLLMPVSLGPITLELLMDLEIVEREI